MSKADNPPRRSRGRPRTQPIDEQAAPVQALDRGLTLLRALARDESLTLTDMALKIGMPPSSAHRMLATLQKHGFAEFDEATQEWSVGIEAFRVGNAYLVGTNLLETAREFMRRLMDETGETANLGIADKGKVIFLSQVESHNPIRAFFRPGTRGLLHASGIGKALLAHMEREEVDKILRKKGLPEFTPKTLTSPNALYADLEATRVRGWSFDDEERYLGMRCIAAPIYNAFGEAVAGISVSGPTVRFPDGKIAEIGPNVKRAADGVTAKIGGRAPLREPVEARAAQPDPARPR